MKIYIYKYFIEINLIVGPNCVGEKFLTDDKKFHIYEKFHEAISGPAYEKSKSHIHYPPRELALNQI